MIKRDPGVSDLDLEQLSALFRLLADKTRLSILLRLAQGERNVTSLCDELGLPQPTISHHLGLLRMNNVVGNRRHGKQVFYVLHGDNVGGGGGNNNSGAKAAEGGDNGTVMEFSIQNLVVSVRPKA